MCDDDRIEKAFLEAVTEFYCGTPKQQKAVLYGVEGMDGKMGLLTTCPPCEYVAPPEPVFFGMDLASGPDFSVAVEVSDNDMRFIVLDPYASKALDMMSRPPIQPRAETFRERPWVEMKRKPWERRRR